jgi:hypothetical protein
MRARSKKVDLDIFTKLPPESDLANTGRVSAARL